MRPTVSLTWVSTCVCGRLYLDGRGLAMRALGGAAKFREALQVRWIARASD